MGCGTLENIMKNIAILTPTRARPGRLDTFIESVYATASNPERVFTYNYIDEDDPRQKAYEDYAAKQHDNSTNLLGETQSVSISWNVLAQYAANHLDRPADILIMGNDDLIYRTPGWDVIVEDESNKFSDDIYCMYMEDLINGEKHCAFPIVSKTWYTTLGYFTPGVFNFGYNDTWVFDVAKKVGRTHFIPNAVNEHMHFTTGKSGMDDTYNRNRTSDRGNLYEKDKIIFENTDKDRQVDAEKLLEIINGQSRIQSEEPDKPEQTGKSTSSKRNKTASKSKTKKAKSKKQPRKAKAG
jgi:glycosyl transferase/beta-hydroxylase protein BlmF